MDESWEAGWPAQPMGTRAAATPGPETGCGNMDSRAKAAS